MKSISTTLAIFALLVPFKPNSHAAAEEGGLVPMFNGRDLGGWVPVNVAPETFSMRDGMIICTGNPTGTLRTERMYENFIIELEWRHLKSGGNSGLFLWGDPITATGTPFSRGIEVQILDDGFNVKGKNEWYTTQGDVFPIHGAKMTPLGRTSQNGERAFPMEERTKASPEWNHYRLVCTNGTISHSINGKEVTRSKDCIPRKGYLCLESEGSEIHFRNVRIKELPSSNPPPEWVAKEYDGFDSLYTGVDLRNFKVDPGHKGHWQPKGWTLNYDGKSSAADKNLWSERAFQDFSLIVDWRPSQKTETVLLPVILPGGEAALDTAALRSALGPKLNAHKSGQWHRFQITRQAGLLSVRLNGELLAEKIKVSNERGPFALRHQDAAESFANIFVKELK